MKIVIMDLDGVICDNSHRAHLVHPVDQQHRNEAWRPFVAECVNDKPIASGIAMLLALSKSHKVIVVTSRQERFKPETRLWLMNNLPGEEEIDVMYRTNDSNDPPETLKRKALRFFIDDCKHDIAFAIDDDPAIIAMYNEEGIATFMPSTRCSSIR